VSPALLALLLAGAPQPPSFGVDVAVVYLDAFVRDGRGPVAGLTASDFVLTDDGAGQEIELVSAESLPLRTVLVLDTSASIDGEKLGQLQRAGRSFLGGLRPGDETALLAFDEELRLRVPFSADSMRLNRGLNGVLPGGATALYDALYAGLTLASGRGRALLVLFTDGEDNMSWLDAAQVARVVQESDVLVQVVAAAPLSEARASASSYLRCLRQLAETTGGRLWRAESPAEFVPAFEAILQAMKTRYVLRFEPRTGARAGLHRLELKLRRRHAEVQCRKTYLIAGPLP
jgi:Ca-activated chloride channel family protein